MQRHREHNSPHRALPGVLQILLHPALVHHHLLRIYKWQSLVRISFAAGILQTIFYGDFIYHFIKSNQNERIINLPIWFVSMNHHSLFTSPSEDYPSILLTLLLHLDFHLLWLLLQLFVTLFEYFWELLAGPLLSLVYSLQIEQLFYFGSLGVVLEFSQFEYFFLHFPTKFDQDSPVFLHCVPEIAILLPILLLLYFLNRVL